MGAKIQIVICIGLRNDGPKQFETYSGEKNIARKLLIMCSHMQVFFVYDAEIICKTASLYVAFCFGPTNNHITPSLNAMWHM